MMTKAYKQILLETIHPLYVLAGHWKGVGRGGYPSLVPFAYEEEMDFEVIKGEPYVQMTQKSWVIKNNTRALIHWETGIISAVGLNELKFYTCHMNGRIEVLNGKYSAHPKDRMIEFESENIKNSDGLKNAIRSKRVFIFAKNSIEYTMAMATSNVLTLKNHLKASLIKMK